MAPQSGAFVAAAADACATYSDLGKIELLNTILDQFPGGIAVYDKDLRMAVCNNSLKRMLDYPDELFEFGMPTMEQVFRFNAMRGEYGKGEIEHMVAHRLDLARKREPHVYERKRPNGMVLEVRGVPLQSGGFLTIYLDVSLQRTKVQEQPKLANADTDRLTGLPPLKAMEAQIDNLLRQRHHGEVACLHCIDLDHFNDLNKRYGTAVGDFVLKEVALRLTAAARGTDFIARTGGDRFQVLQTRVMRPSEVTRLATRLIQEIRKPIRCGHEDISVSASVGFATINDAAQSAVAVIAKANESVIAEKRKHRMAAA
jgi:diguanylate cyclase (GGDEF)-like protein